MAFSIAAAPTSASSDVVEKGADFFLGVSSRARFLAHSVDRYI